MNLLILGAIGINALLVALLMVVFYQSIKHELNAGYRRYKNRRRKRKSENNNIAGFQVQNDSNNDNPFNHWDLSGGIMGI